MMLASEVAWHYFCHTLIGWTASSPRGCRLYLSMRGMHIGEFAAIGKKITTNTQILKNTLSWTLRIERDPEGLSISVSHHGSAPLYNFSVIAYLDQNRHFLTGLPLATLACTVCSPPCNQKDCSETRFSCTPPTFTSVPSHSSLN